MEETLNESLEENHKDLEESIQFVGDIFGMFREKYEIFGSSSYGKALRPSVEEAPTLEHNVLPNLLKYVYLGSDSTLPVVISTRLEKE